MTRDASSPPRTLFLVSPSRAPCGVEAFARAVAAQWPELGGEARLLAITGRAGDLAAIWSALADVDALVINVPVVAWKKALLTPLVALVLALIRGRESVLVLHEWADLDWRRRITVGLYAVFAGRLVFSSPHVRAGFLANRFMRLLGKPTSIAPIPSNIPPVAPSAEPPFAARLREAKAEGLLVIGHFGSIYPRKQCDFVLDVAVRAAQAGRPVLCLFIGGFVKAMDNVEEDFVAKTRRLGLEDKVVVTGYVEEFADINALFGAVDCFLYRFSEGLTSRRSSVLAGLQSGKPVIVNAPCDAAEFDHHRGYRRALADGSLQLVASDADADAYVEVLSTLAAAEPRSAPLGDDGWRDAASAVAASLAPVASAPIDIRA
jgi:glycosyltransferase involved in cell wall biosynthesis